MRKYPMWIIGMGLTAAAMMLGSMATASAATAHPGHLSTSTISVVRQHHVRPPCIIDGDGDCLQTVQGTATPSNGLNIRSGPGTGYSLVGTMPHNGTGKVYCYSSGTNINGDPYWDYVATSWGNGYVSDYYLYTGGNIYDQVDPC